MRERPRGWRTVRASLLVSLLFTAITPPNPAFSAKPKKQPDAPAEVISTGIPRPQLLNAGTDPTLRYPVARMGHGVLSLSFGWFDVTRTSVRYEAVVPPTRNGDSFGASRNEMTGIFFQGLFLEFESLQGNDCRNQPGCAIEGGVVVKNKQTIFYVPQSQWGTFHGGPGVVRAAERGEQVTAAIHEAILNFDRVLSQVEPPAPVVTPAVAITPPEPKPAVPAAPPTIALSAPAGVVANQVLEIKESPVVIRGVAMDGSGIPVVTINNAPANMRPQNAQAAEFWTEPLALQPGDNRIQITASNSAHIETQLVFTAHYTPKPPPNPKALSKPQIISLLQGGVPCSRIASLVKDRGIKFTPSPDDLADLRAAGSDDELLEAIRQAASR